MSVLRRPSRSSSGLDGNAAHEPLSPTKIGMSLIRKPIDEISTPAAQRTPSGTVASCRTAGIIARQARDQLFEDRADQPPIAAADAWLENAAIFAASLN